MKAQCPCATGPERTPNKSCEKCGGSGLTEVFFPSEDNVEALWIGRCPLCGASNGCFVQLKGKLPPRHDPYWKCVNDNCERPPVEFVNIKTVAWYAVCPLCSIIHSADFQQRPDDDPPTRANNPRTCPKPECGGDMVWVLGEELCNDPDL